MTDIKHISIDAYDYPLPEERIAKYPLPERDASKLLVLKDDEIRESQFKHVGEYLPEGALLVFNETKVIRARLQFHKATGSRIEVFCLEPEQDYQMAFSAASPVRWKCLIGNAKRWKEGRLSMELSVAGEAVTLYAERLMQNDQYAEVEFSWTPASLSFAAVLEAAGEIPLPPYLHRDAEPDDRDRYQTVFARYDGSVAAPTAGMEKRGSGLRKIVSRTESLAAYTKDKTPYFRSDSSSFFTIIPNVNYGLTDADFQRIIDDRNHQS